MKILLSLVVVLFAALTCVSQDFVEVRGGITKDGLTYRYIDYNHTFKNGVVVDIVHYGAPGQNELWVGGGYNAKSEQFSAVFAAYAVIGKENKQFGLGLATFGGGKVKKANLTYQVYGFVPAKGSVKKYISLDTLDVTKSVGKRYEIGGSVGAFSGGGTTTGTVGPIFKINDKLGVTSLSVRVGSFTELRFGRTFAW